MKKAVVSLYIIVAFLFGWITYACICDLRFNPEGVAGITVASLGVMVTLLVGWQVYNAIAFKDAVGQIESLRNLAMGYHEASIGISELRHSLENSLFQCVIALERLNMSRNAEYDNLATALRTISETENRFVISNADKRRINSALRNSHNRQCEELIGAFDKWPEA